ncbi:uncharacterized protein LOC125229450 isoform X2 [Leguminivora glycinivorella]|uniref:uncharacterized protein LOC125229450 isoform X2 n=1 Tax=Leguminivora glycinivorella TaxID=1035111 RepID=UPI00200D9319|nr:uncharacterized protein LOC125229450 isoform X2 [Leguminivora glycinivorella]
MKILLLLFVLHTAFSDDFGKSYMKHARLCREWTCINNKLGLNDSLPPRDQYRQVLKGILPEAWHGAVEPTLEGCYVNRTRRYTNTCPGQALLQCTVEKLVENCPNAYWRKNDGCSNVSSLAGFKYMFSQGLYENLEANLSYEQRPPWFMKYVSKPKKYFNSKCCDLPELFNDTTLTECGFTHVMHYHRHSPVRVVTLAPEPNSESVSSDTESTQSGDSIRVVSLPPLPVSDDSSDDPLDCCDMSGFIRPSWRSECDFRLKWDPEARLTIDTTTVTTTEVPMTTTTAKARLDVKVLPLSCVQETCVFRKLNIITDSGTVDIDAFSKMLNNLTSEHPSWSKAKARVVTKCLTRPVLNYDAECEINKVLACTFDVLSENCPTVKKNDPCKHSSTITNDIVCQISSSKALFNRHQFCDIPRLIKYDTVLQECGVSSISRLEYSTHVVPVVKKHEPVAGCKKLTESTTCLLSKMGSLNKYKFMDYFKMKANINDFTRTHTEWLALHDAYISVFTSMPMYRNHCSSPKKLLNLIDAMLMTCPLSARKSSPKCYKMLNEISHSSIVNQNTTKEQSEQMLNQFHYIFFPPNTQQTVVRKTKVTKKYDFGILDNGNVPPVRVIDVNPTARPIKVLLPVYQQMHSNFGPFNLHGRGDSVLRGGPGLP